MSMSGSQKVSAGKKRRRTDQQEDGRGSQEDIAEAMESQMSVSQTSKGGRKVYESMDASTKNRKVSELVRYLLFSHGRKMPVKRKELVEKVVGEDQRAFNQLMDDANHQLESVFGFKAVEIFRHNSKTGTAPPTSSRSYVLVSTLPQELVQDLIHRSKMEQQEVALLGVILSLIMMKQSTVSEEQLWSCLGRLGISADAKYLDRDKVAVGEKHSISYSWGPRAHAELDKGQLLAFIADIYDGNLDQWKRQFADLL